MADKIQIISVKENDNKILNTVSDTPPAIIKVVGAGGGGSNAVNRMIESGLSGVQFIAVNTDLQDLKNKSKAEIRLQIGSKLTGGRGAGGKPSVGEDAANEDHEAISDILRGADMVFVTAGMGGGTGTGSAPIIAKIARDHGALTVGVVTKPFTNEGNYKLQLANEGIKKLREAVDTLIVIPNQYLFKLVDRKTPAIEAYRKVDDVLCEAVQGISDLITKTGNINTDFADVQSTMKGQGDALIGTGRAKGENRAAEATNKAIDNPLLEDTSIEGATKILVNISAPEDIGMFELDDVLAVIHAKADENATVIHGLVLDNSLEEEVKVTVLATGFQNRMEEADRRGYSSRKNDMAAGEVITTDIFDRMRGLGNKTHNDSYDYKPKSHYDNLEVPTAIRKYNPEGKLVSSGKDA